MNSILKEKLSYIDVLICDVDGTLTDGSVTFSSDGAEYKTFNVHDGLGISLAGRHGIEVVFMTGRHSEMVMRRAAELDVRNVLQGISNKREAIDALMSDNNLEPDRIAYIGDDLNDIPAMERVGFVFAVNDANDIVRKMASYVLTKSGGRGAVREAIELILEAKVGMVTVVEEYINKSSTQQPQPLKQ